MNERIPEVCTSLGNYDDERLTQMYEMAKIDADISVRWMELVRDERLRRFYAETAVKLIEMNEQ